MNKNPKIESSSTRRVSPFVQGIEKDEYFTGFGHLNVFASIRRDIDAGVPILVLTGESGCGKSALGKMLMSETISGCIPVYFRKTIDSFEDVVGVMAGEVGVEVSDATRAGIALTIDQIARAIERRGERFLLVCDGAEQIYLATLERIRKMLDRLNSSGVLMQMILIGRPMLLDNMKQLRLCNFDEVPEKRYVLEPFSPAETTSYLEFSKKRMSEEDARLFTPDVVDRIYRASAGNIKKINSLAEDIYNRNGKETSFWVLLEDVEGATDPSGWRRYKRWLTSFTRKRPSARAGLVGGAIVAFGLLLLFVFSGVDEEQPLPAETSVAESVAGNVQDKEKKADLVDPAAVSGEIPDQAAEEVVSTAEATPAGEEQETPAELSPGNTVVVSRGEVAAEDSETSSVLAQEKIAVESGTLPLEQEPLSEERQKVESLLAEAQDAVEAVGRTAGDAAPLGQDGGVLENSAVDRAGKGSAAVHSEESAVPDSVAEDAADLAKTLAPAPPVLRPDKVKKVVITKLEVIRPEGQQANVKTSATLTAAESSKFPRIYGEEAKKKVLPESATVAAVGAVRQSSAGQVAELSGSNGGQDTEESGVASGGISESPHNKVPVESESKKIPVLGQAIVPRKSTVENTKHPNRVDQNPSWLAGKRDGKYTLQLMALSSPGAIENVHQSLAGNGSAQDAGTFYVFEKKGTQPELFVFLGEYDSIADAEKARDVLPEHLRRHKPYVITVKSAMQKLK